MLVDCPLGRLFTMQPLVQGTEVTIPQILSVYRITELIHSGYLKPRNRSVTERHFQIKGALYYDPVPSKTPDTM